jgi:multidrug efflux pump subunit AcrB
VALLSMIFGFFLFSQRPAAFLPQFGEPQVTINVEMPGGTRILETNERVAELETFIADTIPSEQVTTIQTTVGGGGASFDSILLGGAAVQENRANVVVGLDVGQTELNEWTRIIRTEAEAILGEENVTVSAMALGGDFGGFELIVSGPLDELVALDPIVIETLNNIDGITNVSSNLSEAAANQDGPPMYIRVNMETAASYSAELETQNTIGITNQAVETIESLPQLSENIRVSQGFQSEVQTEGFNSLPIAMGIAFVIVALILIAAFGSFVYWLAIVMSVFVAPVGAAIALTLTDRVLGISAMIGLLMLLGLVVTNAVVLIDRVRTNRSERNMPVYDALIEAGGRRLRPILMTSLATIIALTPLAIGLSDGAIIASELGTVVIGGVFSSTLLTLIVVPVAYSLLHPLHQRLSIRRSREE